MAEAIISGMTEAGLDVNIVVSEPIADRAKYLADSYGVTVAANNVNAVLASELAVLAVKPQQLADVAEEISDVVPSLERVTFMSIMAGVQAKTIIEQIGCDRLIRIMANTPSQVGIGRRLGRLRHRYRLRCGSSRLRCSTLSVCRCISRMRSWWTLRRL